MIFKIFLITWLFTHIDFIQHKIDDLFMWLDQKVNSKYRNIILDKLYILLGCHKCLGFWITLIVTFNIFSAILVAYVAYIMGLIENKLNNE